MPFADMGKGILFQSLPRDTRVFVVQFKGKRCDLYFAPSKGMEPKLIPALAASAIPPGTFVLVEADRGVDLGMIKEELTTPEAIRAAQSQPPSGTATATTSSAGSVSSAKDVYIKRIFREADQREVADMMGNKVVDEQKALSMCQSKVTQRRLSMSVVDAEFQFDRRKLTFYFTADRRVDFRELVRELFKHFKTRIWMCQQTN
ncbi:PSP1-domain-containing protein [Martensiomyces pterosporus]|nr:PSP1-domain-containing protein [Martensiomyces pterosporus]